MGRLWKFLPVLIFSVVIFCAPLANAITVWDESVNGDFSNDDGNPTNLGILSNSSNEIIGSIGRFSDADTDDAFIFTVPDGYILSEFILTSYDFGFAYDYAPFHLYSGPSTSDPTLEFILMTNSSSGTDLLQFDSAPGPQPAGTFLLDIGGIQVPAGTSIDGEQSMYSIAINLESPQNPVPEPATMLLLASGLVGLAGFGRKRFKK